jgi:hypothetical protein
VNGPQLGRRKRTLAGDRGFGSGWNGGSGGWLKGDGVPEGFELGDEPAGFAFGVQAAGEVVDTVRERGLGGDLAGQGALIQRDAHDEADAVLEASGQQLIFGLARNRQRDGRSGGFAPYTFVNVSLRRAAASS